MSSSCLACGAKMDEDLERCDLCGTPAGTDPNDMERVSVLGSDQDSTPVVATSSGEIASGNVSVAATGSAGATGVFCNACGWKNPPGARFCSRCGEGVQAIAGEVRVESTAGARQASTPAAVAGPVSIPDASNPAADGRGKTSDPEVGKRVGIIVGSAVMVVLALYLIAVVRQGSGPQAPVAIAGQAAPLGPLPPGIVQQVEALDDSVSQAEGESRLGFMRQIVELYLRAARYDFAGNSQELVAQETLLEIDWVFAGNLFYDQMERSDEVSGQRTLFAKKAIAAYQEALTLNPDNLDVRTDMAVAYLSDPDNPMSAIQETQAVLQQDSLHVQANFNRGIMLSRINRLDEAIKQFRKVQRIIGDPTAEIHERAQSAIDRLSAGL